MDKVETVSTGVSSTMLTNIVNPLDAVFKGAMVGVKADQLNVQQSALEDILIPPAPRLADSLRNASGDKITAMGDLVDNSIDAGADEIQILLGKLHGKGVIMLADNGCGMTKEVLMNALTLGLHTSNNTRCMGRFGMGLKISCGHLGDSFEILTRTDDGQLLFAVFDYNKIREENRWVAQVGTASPEQIKTFEKTVGQGSGTILTIKNIQWASAESMKISLEAPLRKYLGRTFRYWLTPMENATDEKAEKCKISLTINDESVFGTNPLELHVPSTRKVLDSDIDIGQGRKVHVIVVLLEKNECPQNTKDPGPFYFRPNHQTQGIYVVRENREILAAQGAQSGIGGDFSPIWGGKRMELNYCRIELRYTNLDDVFVVTHGKDALKHIEQSVMDTLANVLRPWVKAAQDVYREKVALDQVTDEVIQKFHNSISKTIGDKSALLVLPEGKKVERHSSKKVKKGTVTPKGTSARRYGIKPNPKSKVRGFSIELFNWGSGGQLFDFHISEKDTVVVQYNVQHPYYARYVAGREQEQVYGIDLMSCMVAAILLKKIASSEDQETATAEVDNIKQDISSNLRALSV